MLIRWVGRTIAMSIAGWAVKELASRYGSDDTRKQHERSRKESKSSSRKRAGTRN